MEELCARHGAHSREWVHILTRSVSENQPGGDKKELEVRTPVTQPGETTAELRRCTKEEGSDDEGRAGQGIPGAESAPHKRSFTRVINEWTPFIIFSLNL